jgi:hypothetical protein
MYIYTNKINCNELYLKQISYGNDLVVQAAKNREKWVAIFYEPVKHCDFLCENNFF